jgi:hypothetical protein
MSFRNISWMTLVGAEDGLRIHRPEEMAVEELPLGPYMEIPTANRDRRSGEEFAT